MKDHPLNSTFLVILSEGQSPESKDLFKIPPLRFASVGMTFDSYHPLHAITLLHFLHHPLRRNPKMLE